jgi:hypothetical protein
MQLHGAAISPDGQVVAGINTSKSQFFVLGIDQIGYNDQSEVEATKVFKAAAYSAPGATVGRLAMPVGLAVGRKREILVLENGLEGKDGTKRMQVFNQLGSSLTALKDTDGKPSAIVELDADVTYQDIAADVEGYVFAFGRRGTGAAVKDYVLHVFKPSVDAERLFEVHSVNVGRMALGYYRDVYTLNFKAMGTPDGGKQPSLSIWTARTHRFIDQ